MADMSSAKGAPAATEESKGASLKVKPLYPVGSFTVEGIPEITAAGTMLTSAQFKKAEESAAVCGVVLASEEVK